MNTNLIIVIICMILGIMIHVAARYFYPWSKKEQPLFWIGAFAPMILMSFMHLENDMISNSVYAVCGGAIFSEFFRPKIEAWKQSFFNRMEGDKNMYSQKTKSSKKRTTKKRQ